ncbi:conserved hypothetical protein [Frankia sp. AgKG'84/4]
MVSGRAARGEHGPGVHPSQGHRRPLTRARGRAWLAGAGVLALAATIVGCGPRAVGTDQLGAGATPVGAGAVSESPRPATPSASPGAGVTSAPGPAVGDPPAALPGRGVPPAAAPQVTRSSTASAAPAPRPTATPGAPGAPGAGRVPGGLSGISAGSLSEVRAWEQFRGSPVDVIVTFSDRSGWAGITQPWLGTSAERFAGFTGIWVISQPFFPTDGGDIASCAAGAYDERWRQFGDWLVRQGRGASIVRPAWEFNGAWFPWSVSKDRTNWVPCFRQVVTSIRATAPQVRIDWTFNAHNTDAFEYYPGDEYVDIVGVDTYDQWPANKDEATFTAQCEQPTGLCAGIAFARKHGKQFSVPEWGLVGTSDTGASKVGQAGGDNPVYISMMHKTMYDNADILAYEAYFNDDLPNNVHSSLINPTTHPKGAALYAQLW